MRSLLVSFLLFSNTYYAQETPKRDSIKLVTSAQFAGSTGLYSAGVSKVSRTEKIELGFLCGYVPSSFGGPLASLVLKFAYNPFNFKIINKIRIEPFQTGVFFAQNFGDNLDVIWGKQYPKGYYWWHRSLRTHFFISTQVSYKIGSKSLDRIAAYFEVNTNDLYLYSFFPNRKSIKIYDIFFFGTGLKLYFKLPLRLKH